MKKLFFVIATAMLVFTACKEDYDDSALWKQMNEFEMRLVELERMCQEMNSNISSLQGIVAALQTGDWITSVTPIVEDGKEVGYKISFAVGDAIIIYHGADGADGVNGANGVDGATPTIGVKMDTDGIYYWTLNGEWLLDDAGNKIKAVGTDGENGDQGEQGPAGENGADGTDGKDGITPQLKIENGCWFVSTDNGATWTNLGKATGEDGKDGADGAPGQDGTNGADGKDGDSMFSSVEETDTEVIFVLADGTTITIPKAAKLDITFSGEGEIACMAGKSVRIDFTVTPASMKPAIETIGENGWKTKVAMSSDSAGYLLVSAPDPIVDGKVLVFISDNCGHTAMKSLHFVEGLFTMTTDAYSVAADAATFEVQVTTNIDYTVEIDTAAQSWLSVAAATRAEVRTDKLQVSVAENPEDSPARTGDIRLLNSAGEAVQTITVTQQARPTADPITFADPVVKEFLVDNYDTNGDGEISYKEAAAVTEFTTNFPVIITSFDELQYFTGITSLSGFEGCSNLKSVVISDGVTKIGVYAFRNCSSLTSVTIPDSVTEIVGYAFYGCSSLTSVTIPDSVTEIGNYAFSGCSSLTSVDIPNSVTEIGYDAFENCSSLTSVTIPNGVTEIGSSAFSGCSSLTSVDIPNSVTKIGYGAFSNCSSLTSVTIPDSVTEIGNSAFYGCSSLTSVDIPNSVTKIGYGAFSNCSSLTSVTIPNSVTEIGGKAFNGCSSLTSVTIPNGVTEISNSAFYGCSGLTSVTIPNSVTEIGGNAFNGCSSLTSVTIPNGVTEISNSAFYGCSNLNSFYGKYASSDNRCLVRYGELLAFAPCGITDYTTPNDVVTISTYAFQDCDTLISLVLSDGVTTISDSAFSGCDNLTSVTIPNSVTEIGGNAFNGCSSLTSVTIPDSVTKIGNNVFYDCKNLHVYCKALVPPTLGSRGLSNSSTGFAGIYVPTESVDAYKAAEGWSKYADKIVGYDFE